MKKMDYLMLMLSVMGILLFGIGMCMALLPEWNMMKEGIVFGCAGAALQGCAVMVYRREKGMTPIVISLKTIGIVLYGTLAALVFGAGMSMVLVQPEMMIKGIVLGVVGIFLLLGLIPVIKGLR